MVSQTEEKKEVSDGRVPSQTLPEPCLNPAGILLQNPVTESCQITVEPEITITGEPAKEETEVAVTENNNPYLKQTSQEEKLAVIKQVLDNYDLKHKDYSLYRDCKKIVECFRLFQRDGTPVGEITMKKLDQAYQSVLSLNLGKEVIYVK